MNPRLRRLGRQIRSSLWFRPAAYSVSAVVSVVACSLVQRRLFPYSWARIDEDLVSTLLDIITTSMLTVTTFAVGSMVTAYASATTSGTPRAFALIIADGTSQKAASSFIGAFIFGVIATIGLESETFRPSGVLLLFLLTVGIFVWVIGTFIRWIDNIARLGQIGTSITKAEAAASDALDRVTDAPFLGGARQSGSPGDGAAVYPRRFGYLSHITMFELDELAAELDTIIHVRVRPGALLDPSLPVAAVEGCDELDDEIRERIQLAFEISDERSFSSDPEFGLQVLAEIGAKALSPGVNDPGTALTVVNAVTRQIAEWHDRQRDPETEDATFPNVTVPAIATHRLVRAGFDLIARYGIGDADVVRHLMSAFRYLEQCAGGREEDEIEAYARDVLTEARGSLGARDYREVVAHCPDRFLPTETADHA